MTTYRVAAERAETVTGPSGEPFIRPHIESQCHLLRADGGPVCDVPRRMTPVDRSITWELLRIGQHCPICTAYTDNATA
ncbi:MAG: hypothetical protein ACJ74O_01560 [Frankiaceae bacterium]